MASDDRHLGRREQFVAGLIGAGVGALIVGAIACAGTYFFVPELWMKGGLIGAGIGAILGFRQEWRDGNPYI